MPANVAAGTYRNRHQNQTAWVFYYGVFYVKHSGLAGITRDAVKAPAAKYSVAILAFQTVVVDSAPAAPRVAASTAFAGILSRQYMATSMTFHKMTT